MGADKVLIDGREILKKRGIGHFCRELLYNINEACAGGTRKYYCAIPDDTPQSAIEGLKNIAFIRIGAKNPIVWEQVHLPFAALRLGARFLVCPYNTFPVVVPPGCTRVIVYHDLIFLQSGKVGGSRTLRIGNKYRSCLLRFLKPSDRLLTVSTYTRDVVWRKLGRKSEVIGNSCRHLQQIFDAAESPALGGAYFLHVGGDATTKNTEHTVRSYMAAARETQDFPKLVVMGVSPNYAAALGESLDLEGRVEFRLGVSDAEKCALVKGAVASVFVSRREGFGLPIIEAQAAGTRVITSRRRPMSDLASSEDILVDPSSTEELIMAYKEVIEERVLNMRNVNIYDQFKILEGTLS